MKVTMYTRGMFGVQKTEVTRFEVKVGPWAQYSAAVHVEFLPKGKRKMRCMVQSYGPSLLVLEGWGHADPANPLEERTDGSSVSRYLSCDPRYQTDFDTMIAEYIQRTGARVVHDYRGHNPHGAAVA